MAVQAKVILSPAQVRCVAFNFIGLSSKGLIAARASTMLPLDIYGSQ